MVLQVGVVRRRLAVPSEDHDLLNGVELAGRNALAEMRRLLAAMRREGEEAELVPQPGLDRLDSLLDEVGRAGFLSDYMSTAGPSRSREGSTSLPTASSRKA